jgi:hypothetical protein
VLCSHFEPVGHGRDREARRIRIETLAAVEKDRNGMRARTDSSQQQRVRTSSRRLKAKFLDQLLPSLREERHRRHAGGGPI